MDPQLAKEEQKAKPLLTFKFVVEQWKASKQGQI